MKTFDSFINPARWLLAFLMAALVAGCGGGGDSDVGPSSAKAITAYSLTDGVTIYPGTINTASKTIAVTMPFGKVVTGLVATFTTTGSSVKVGAAAQTSGITSNSFAAPVVYTVTAVDVSTATYTVTVTFAKAFTAFSLAGIPGVINETAGTIAVTVPNGTAVNPMTATFATTAASVSVVATGLPQTSGTTANDFSVPVVYTVTGTNAVIKTYTVTVTVASLTAKAITAFSLGGIPGTINETAKTVVVTMPSGTAVTALIATFTTTGANVAIGLTPQTSGTTPNSFAAPVVYTVTAADASTVTYTITVNVAGAGPAPVPLGAAGNFVILTKSGVTNVPASAITGDVGTSPITGASIVGLGCPEVTGTIYSVDAAGPACKVTDDTYLTTSVSDMETAYTDASGRPAGVGPNLNLGGGTVAGQTLTPGTYTWGSNVTITTNLTLTGAATDVWIFQITGTLDMAASMNVLLAGGALPKNIFWVVADTVTLGTGSHFEGVILAQKDIALITGASTNGRLLAQTAVTLQSNTVTQPAP